MTGRRRLAGAVLAATILALLGGTPSPVPAQTGLRYANPTDPTCGGHSPCYTTIQAAVNALLAGEIIQLQPGTYHEQVNVTGKNNTAGASEADRIVIQADPAAAVGSVVLQGSVTQCTNGYAVKLQQSKFITLRGLTITGAGGQAVSLLGGNNANQAIHLERLRIFGNGSSSCDGGVTIARGNPDTLLLNSLIYGNGRNGFATIDADGGPHYLIGNTIHGNAWSGVSVTRSHVVFLVNNAITGNGTATGSTGGRFGVSREASSSPDPTGIHLLNNLVCGNRLGEVNGPALDGTDAGNLTPTGTEGPGVAASPGCDVAANVYAHVAGPDGVANTGDDDFTPVTASPLLDAGFDPRTLGLSTAFNPLLESDYTKPAARPRLGAPGGTARFDIGAREPDIGDEIAPLVTIQAPPANAYVRGQVPVQAQATDEGTGIASFTLRIDSQPLTVTLTPSLPPPAPSVSASAIWNTPAFPDGAHTLTAEAHDAAGNPGSATRVLIVDNTAPDTQIASGPSGEILVGTATFTFTGTDNLTPAGNLLFAWRLDGGAWSGFSAAASASLSGLLEGQHTFEVKAQDLAGNEAVTPASRSFSVRFSPSITNVDPNSGTIGTYVTITGTNFEPGSSTVNFNGLAAVLRTVSATQITTTVPIGATTGPLVVTTSHGSASVTFTVGTTGDFTLTAAPAPPATARVIAGDQISVSIAAGGTGSFTSLVSLSISIPPSGVTASFAPSNLVAPGASVFLTLGVGSGVAPGTYSLTVTGGAQVDGRTLTRTAAFALEVLAPDTRAVTGRVLTAEAVPQPIPGVTVTLGSAFVLTDAGGNFVLLAPPTGPSMLFVDGRTASTPSAQYPIVEINVTVAGSGPSRVPFNIYLPKLDTANPINLPLDAAGFTTQEVKATTPRIPGLEVTIPQGTRIIGPDGNPVSQLVITPVPIDRSPMPFPPGKAAPMLFAINPGGAVPSQPLPISFPNVTEAAPGTKADLYFFDLAIGGWNTWGTGTVSADGKQVVSDPGFGLPRLAWHWWDILRAGLARLWKSLFGGDPVDLATGVFTVDKTDLVLPGRIPVSVRRSYRSDDTRPGFFGIGWNVATYDNRLTSTGATLNLITTDQNTLQLRPSGPGQWVSSESVLLGAVVTQLPGEFNFQIRYKDGTLHRYDRIVGFANTAGLSAISDRNGNTVTITRSSPAPGLFGLITQITEPAGRSLTLAYDGAGRITSATDPIGRVVQYAYDAQGRLSTVTEPAGGVTRYTYDSNHRILTVTDPRNITYLTNEYDVQGRVTRQTQADGGVFTFAYAVVGPTLTQTTVIDPRGNPTIHRFNNEGLPQSTTDSLGQTIVFEYTPGSNLLAATTDPLGRVTRFTYDTLGNLTSTVDPTGALRTFTHDPLFSRVASIAQPLTPPTQFGYDPHGNLTTITDPLGNITTLTYNTAGQPVTAADPLGHTQTFTYDSQGNLVTTADPLGNTVGFQYDLVGRRVRQTDQRGKLTTFAYDPLNHITSVANATGTLMRFTYDPNGNLLSVTDPQGGVVTRTYDVMDRVATRSDQLGAAEERSYDALGNLIRRVDRRGQTSSFEYDGLNRRRLLTYHDGSSVAFSYDAGGRLVLAVDSATGAVCNAYDVLDRVVAQSTSQGTVTYQYDAAGRRVGMQAPGQDALAYAYDAASRLTQLSRGPSVTAYQYDVGGRRTRLTLSNGASIDYEYDAEARLKRQVFRNTTGVLGDLSYAYDAAGNRTQLGGSLATTVLPSPALSATYDAANRQLTFGSQTLSWDSNGNLGTVSDPGSTMTLTWDSRNRLVGVTLPGSTVAFKYDAFGRRVRRSVEGQATEYVYDGLDVIQEVSPISSVALLRAPDLDQPLVRGGSEFYLSDALGSIIGLTDIDGLLRTRYGYEPFGAPTPEGTSSENRFEFSAREWDAPVGLYYYRARYYSPFLHRFITEDPLGGGSSGNSYAYADNNPVSRTDPLGLQAVPMPGPIPLPFPGPVLIPGSPENRALTQPLIDLVERLRESLSSGVSPFPDPADPPGHWIPIPGKGDTWKDPDTGEVWHWHPDPTGGHGGDHWDIGGPRGPNGEKGRQDWWPKGGEREPKPPGGDRAKMGCRKC